VRVLLVSEGQHEQSGALETLVRRLAPRVGIVEQDRIARTDIHATHGKQPGYERKAVRWILEAMRRGFDAVVLVVDQDKDRKRLKQINDAQQSKSSDLPRALGVAIRSFDAWMLADETALSKALGVPVQRQPDPETQRDPKERCTSLLKQCEKPLSQRDMYAAVASDSDLDLIRQRCPEGFGSFADRVTKLGEAVPR